MKLTLIDGYGFVFRAYHSLPPLTAPDGTVVGAVYGFCNMLHKVLAQHDSDFIAVALDSGSKNFRHDLFPEYKANRLEPEEDLKKQFPIIREAVDAFNIPALELKGYEADDLLAAYARAAAAAGLQVRIISSDKDLVQLLNDSIEIYDPMKEVLINRDLVNKKFEVEPEQMVDYLSMLGDSSDNIPGVRGIGKKTAAELLAQFGSLEEIYANLEKIPQKRRRELLEEGREAARMSKELISLDRQYDFPVDYKPLEIKDIEPAKFVSFCDKYGFKSLKSRVDLIDDQEVFATERKRTTANFTQISDSELIGKLIPKIIDNGYLALHLDDDFLYLSSGEDVHLQIDKSTQNEALVLLKEVLAAKSLRKELFDARTWHQLLRELDIELVNYDDIAIMAYSCDTLSHGYKLADLMQLYANNPQQVTSDSINYAYFNLRQKLLHEHKYTIYYEIDKKLQVLLLQIEGRGVKVNQAALAGLSQDYAMKIREIAAKIYAEAGEEFNIGSPKQLGDVLFNRMGIRSEGVKKSKTGSYSTGSEVLEQLSAEGFTIAEDILEWRHFSKLMSTYTEALPKSISPKTGRIHTTLSQISTATGRLSSSNPNLQNIPIRSDEGEKIRRCFIASPGCKIISADYSQIELRLLSFFADIPQLKQAFREGRDIHAATASEMFGVALDQVNSEQRRQAKMINFGIIYGISAHGLATRLGIERKVAADYIEKYFQRYPNIRQYMDKMIETARRQGYVTTELGRKCFTPEINSKNYTLRAFAERAAINAPLQGTAADIIKLAMVALKPDIAQYMILQIHDELLFEVPEDKVEEYSQEIRKAMQNVSGVTIPLIVDIGVGDNWADAH
jgi:DNA polymerase-1